MRGRENEPTLPDPLAFLFTWTTYGTWLPGDERGWMEYHRGWKLPSPPLVLESQAKMSEDACVLSSDQRQAVEAQIRETCAFRRWELHAVNCRTNHVHAVISATERPRVIRSQIKAWCTRRLRDNSDRQNWWSERGSIRWIFDIPSFDAAIAYVLEGQDGSRFQA